MPHISLEVEQFEKVDQAAVLTFSYHKVNVPSRQGPCNVKKRIQHFSVRFFTFSLLQNFSSGAFS